MQNNNSQISNRCFTSLYDHYFIFLEEEAELALFQSKHVPVIMVNVSGKIMYWVEVLDFLNTLLPEIGFSKAYIYKTEDKAYCRAQMKDTHIDKRQLSILNNHCKDYILDVCEENFSDGGSPLGSSLDIVIPLQW